MLKELVLGNAYRVTPTGLYLISTAYQGKRNVQFAFRALGLTDDPPMLLIGVQADNFSREVISKAASSSSMSAGKINCRLSIRAAACQGARSMTNSPPSAWRLCRQSMSKRRWSPAATPTSNANWSIQWNSTAYIFSSVKPWHPTSTIKCSRWAGWRERLFAWINRFNLAGYGGLS